MADLHHMFGVEPSHALPSSPHIALFLGGLFQRLGGSFSICSTGSRGIGTPMSYALDELPQLPGARPHEQFHNGDEWTGAMKLVQTMLSRLDKTDRDYLFDAFASAAVDERKFTPAPAEPARFERRFGA